MLNLIKKYWTHAVSILFLVSGILCFYPVAKGGLDLEGAIPTSMMVTLALLFISVVALLIEISYFKKKALESDEENKNRHSSLIYSLSLFYIPCYNLKYVVKEEKYKTKNIIYLIVSIIFFIIMAICIAKASLIVNSFESISYETHQVLDNRIEVTIEDNYEVTTSTSSKVNFDRGYESIILIESEVVDANELMNVLEDSFESIQSTYETIVDKTIDYEDKEVVTRAFEFDYEDTKNVSTFAVIKFKNKDVMLVLTQDSVIDDYDEEELNKIYESMKLKE